MIKYLLPILLTFTACSQAPKNTTKKVPHSLIGIAEDSLVNYSYMLTQMNGSNVLGTGTGQIIHYNNTHYLVTNFHVLTCKDSKTNKPFPDSPGTVTEIAIVFQPEDKKSAFVPMIYSLTDIRGQENYMSLKIGNQIMDIAAMPIVIPDRAAKYTLEVSDVDSSTVYDSTSRYIFLGFPGGQFINTWQPTKIETHGVINPDKQNFDPFVFIDIAPVRGMSGSAIYKADPAGAFKMFGILSNQVNYLKEAPKMKGRGVQAKWVLYVIEKLNSANRSPVIGSEYRNN